MEELKEQWGRLLGEREAVEGKAASGSGLPGCTALGESGLSWWSRSLPTSSPVLEGYWSNWAITCHL